MPQVSLYFEAQADFDVQRAGGSLPYALTMIGFMIGGITVGRFADRFGILPPFSGARSSWASATY